MEGKRQKSEKIKLGEKERKTDAKIIKQQKRLKEKREERGKWGKNERERQIAKVKK